MTILLGTSNDFPHLRNNGRQVDCLPAGSVPGRSQARTGPSSSAIRRGVMLGLLGIMVPVVMLTGNPAPGPGRLVNPEEFSLETEAGMPGRQEGSSPPARHFPRYLSELHVYSGYWGSANYQESAEYYAEPDAVRPVHGAGLGGAWLLGFRLDSYDLFGIRLAAAFGHGWSDGPSRSMVSLTGSLFYGIGEVMIVFMGAGAQSDFTGRLMGAMTIGLQFSPIGDIGLYAEFILNPDIQQIIVGVVCGRL